MSGLLISLLIAYLLGSIPTAVWVGRLFFGVDVREHGSGNAGATNTIRVLGVKPGVGVLLFDVSKGAVATSQASWSWNQPAVQALGWEPVALILGFIAVLGHVFPVFAGFKGGKGVATVLGLVLVLHTPAALFSLGIFTLVFVLTGYVSLGSMLAALAFPISLGAGLYGEPNALVLGFGTLLALAIVATHRKNIERLRAGTESRLIKPLFRH